MFIDNFYEPSYASGRAVRWKLELVSGDPFGIACLWDRWIDPASGELVVSFSVLTTHDQQDFNLDTCKILVKPGMIGTVGIEAPRSH